MKGDPHGLTPFRVVWLTAYRILQCHIQDNTIQWDLQRQKMPGPV